MAKAELLFVGTDTGVLQYSNPGGIGRWLRSGHSLPGSDIIALWANPDDPTQLLCSDGEQLYDSTDGGQHWSDPVELGITAFVASRSTPDRILARTANEAILSTDAGEHWRRIAAADRIATSNTTLAITTDARAHQSSDGGTTWQPDEPWVHRAVSPDGNHTVVVSSTGMWSIDGVVIPPAPVPMHTVAVMGGEAHIVASDGHQVWVFRASCEPVQGAPALTLITNTSYHPDRLWGADAAGTLWYSTTRGLAWEAQKHQLGTIHVMVSARLL